MVVSTSVSVGLLEMLPTVTPVVRRKADDLRREGPLVGSLVTQVSSTSGSMLRTVYDNVVASRDWSLHLFVNEQ